CLGRAGVAGPAPAGAVECWFGITDVTSASGVDPDGTFWEYITYYYGWSCTDGYLPDERPYDPSTVGGGGGPAPTPTPPPPSSCSLSSCLRDCDAAYMRDAGVEVIGDTIIQHFHGPSGGLVCMELSNADGEARRGMCVSDCNAP